MMPGEFEERLKAVTVEIEQSGRRIILFIDDIHNLVSQGGRVVWVMWGVFSVNCPLPASRGRLLH
jgi:hypothetical protein